MRMGWARGGGGGSEEEGRKRWERSKGERKERGEGSSRRRTLDVINDKIGPPAKPRGSRVEIKTQFKWAHGYLIPNTTDLKSVWIWVYAQKYTGIIISSYKYNKISIKKYTSIFKE